MYKIIAGIFVFLVLLILIFQVDDRLEPGIPDFLAKASTTGNSDAYFYLMGIDAAADETPLLTGRKIFNSKFSDEKSADKLNKPPTLTEQPVRNKLPLPGGPLFCESWKQACFPADHDKIDKVLISNDTLLRRYQRFISMNDYKTLSKPTSFEPVPPYKYLRTGNQLVMLKAIKTASQNTDQAVDILITNISALRDQLRKADSLMGKMIFLSLISPNIDTLSVLNRKGRNKFETKLPLLSSEERDLENAMAREFAMMYEYINQIDNLEKLSLDGNGINYTPNWLARIFIKPNMTINAIYRQYKNIAMHSQLTQKEFTEAIKTIETVPAEEFSIRNYGGKVLIDIARPDFYKYITRLFDLNAKIVLFNKTADINRLPEDLSFMNNPYYDDGQSAHYAKDKKKICFGGPQQACGDSRCLRISL